MLVQNAIKMKEQNSKMKLLNKDSCASSKTKSKGPKCHDHHTHILEPDNTNILTEEIDIKTSLQQHFSSIGKNERIDPSLKVKSVIVSITSK